jgi:hypothetical protein
LTGLFSRQDHNGFEKKKTAEYLLFAYQITANILRANVPIYAGNCTLLRRPSYADQIE